MTTATGLASAGRPPRDGQRSRVYAAEERWEARLDAARRGARRATIAGSEVLLPEELRFGSLEAAAAYASGRAAAHALPPVSVRTRRGPCRATWTSDGVIALPVPVHGEPWALRESVLLHELAHHAAWHTSGSAGHGPEFTAQMLELVGSALGPEAQLALRVDYAELGVRVAA